MEATMTYPSKEEWLELIPILVDKDLMREVESLNTGGDLNSDDFDWDAIIFKQ